MFPSEREPFTVLHVHSILNMSFFPVHFISDVNCLFILVRGDLKLKQKSVALLLDRRSRVNQTLEV